MASLWNCKLWVDEMISWWNGKLMKQYVGKIVIWWNGNFYETTKLKKLLNDEIVRWSQIDKMVNWQNNKLMKR